MHVRKKTKLKRAQSNPIIALTNEMLLFIIGTSVQPTKAASSNYLHKETVLDQES